MTTRVAAIDCGTNSIRLLVADLDPVTGELTDLERTMRIVRLGQGVDRTGRLAPEALARTFAACRDYAEAIRAHGVPVERTRFVATSASRDAENRDEFVRGVLDILGVEPVVISGDTEADFSFTGATRELTGEHGLHAPYLVVDIGGGSTEFVLGEGEGPGAREGEGGGSGAGGDSGAGEGSGAHADGVVAARSVDIGSVRMTERHLVRDGVPIDPATPEAVAAMTADIDAAIDQAARHVPLEKARTLVGLAGSVTTVAAIALGLDHYDPEVIHHARIPLDQVREVSARLLAADHAERAAISVIHRGRVDVIAAGALILLRVMERIGAREVVVSEHDILDGIAFDAAGPA